MSSPLDDPRIMSSMGQPPPPPTGVPQYDTLMLDQSFAPSMPQSGPLPVTTGPPPTAPLALSLPPGSPAMSAATFAPVPTAALGTQMMPSMGLPIDVTMDSTPPDMSSIDGTVSLGQPMPATPLGTYGTMNPMMMPSMGGHPLVAPDSRPRSASPSMGRMVPSMVGLPSAAPIVVPTGQTGAPQTMVPTGQFVSAPVPVQPRSGHMDVYGGLGQAPRALSAPQFYTTQPVPQVLAPSEDSLGSMPNATMEGVVPATLGTSQRLEPPRSGVAQEPPTTQPDAAARARQLELERQLAEARSETARHQADAARHQERQSQQQRHIENLSKDSAMARDKEAEHHRLHSENAQAKAALQQQVSQAASEADAHKARAAKAASELESSKQQHQQTRAEMEQRLAEFDNVQRNYSQQLAEDRRRISELEKQLRQERGATEHHAGRNNDAEQHISKLEEEVRHLRAAEAHHKSQNDNHKKEVTRLKRIRDENAPPPFVPRMPLKGLEEKVMHLACFMMFSLCMLPAMGAIAVLMDRNYVFWVGVAWPLVVISGCLIVFFTFAVTVDTLFRYAGPEHRSQFTMFFTWAVFASFLGIILVPVALFANKHAQYIASTVSQGCLSTLPQSEMLVDYSQVLYNIRLSQNCTNERSVVDCKGWSRNEYTDYLQYLEYDFHCGPLCPENPPPARAVASPGMYNAPLPTIRPVYSPPLLGPPLQGIKAFLQGESQAGGRVQRRHDQQARGTNLAVPGLKPGHGSIMETALPHMQALKLFDHGHTRMTCFPLVATRLQVLNSTFGGLWYWEGVGLIIISFLTSLYTGCYFAFSKNVAPPIPSN